MDNIEKIIDSTVNKTITKLKVAGLMKNDRKTAFKKTEELLRNYVAFKYNALNRNDQPHTFKLIEQIEYALSQIKDDPYFDVIIMIYFENISREEIADKFGTTVTTISRNKTRLVNVLKSYLFSDDVIYELFL